MGLLAWISAEKPKLHNCSTSLDYNRNDNDGMVDG